MLGIALLPDVAGPEVDNKVSNLYSALLLAKMLAGYAVLVTTDFASYFTEIVITEPGTAFVILTSASPDLSTPVANLVVPPFEKIKA